MPEADVVPMNSLSLSAAQRVTEAALAVARSENVAVCITVCDPTGEPIVTVRMDGAPRLSVGVATNKACELVGAIGVSGGSAAQDQQIAEIAAVSLGAS